jgi:hypothetical protein
MDKKIKYIREQTITTHTGDNHIPSPIHHFVLYSIQYKRFTLCAFRYELLPTSNRSLKSLEQMRVGRSKEVPDRNGICSLNTISASSFQGHKKVQVCNNPGSPRKVWIVFDRRKAFRQSAQSLSSRIWSRESLAGALMTHRPGFHLFNVSIEAQVG